MMIYSRYMLKVLVWIISILSCSLAAQVTPFQYRISPRPLSRYGSSENGNCSTTPTNNNRDQLCTTPETSYFFDGIVPFFNGTNNNNCWASQLLVLDIRSAITLDFKNPSSGTLNIEGLEIVMLNCPERSIGATSINIQANNGRARFIDITERSCDHLIRVCASFNAITTTTVFLSFETIQNQIIEYLAEITLYSAKTGCAAGIIESSISTSMQCSPATHSKIMNKITTVNKDSTTMEVDTTRETNTVNHSSISTSVKDNNSNSSTKTINTDSNVVAIAVVATIIFILIISLTVILTALVANKKIREKIKLKIAKNLSKTCNNHEESVMYFPDTDVDDKFEVNTYATINHQEEKNHTNKSLTKNNCSTSDSEKDHTLSQMYAVVNKNSKKNKTKRSSKSDSHNISEMYAIVDENAKKKAATVKSSNSDVSEMYAVVDKSSKKTAKEGLSGKSSPGTSELYAIVNKKAKKEGGKGINESSPGVSDVYAVVDKSKKQQRVSKGQ